MPCATRISNKEPIDCGNKTHREDTINNTIPVTNTRLRPTMSAIRPMGNKNTTLPHNIATGIQLTADALACKSSAIRGMAIFTAERAKEQIIITKPTLTSAMRLALGV